MTRLEIFGALLICLATVPAGDQGVTGEEAVEPAEIPHLHHKAGFDERLATPTARCRNHVLSFTSEMRTALQRAFYRVILSRVDRPLCPIALPSEVIVPALPTFGSESRHHSRSVDTDPL